MKRKYIIWGVLIAVVFSMGFKLYGNKKIINEKNSESAIITDIAIPVLVDSVQYKSIENTIKKTASLVPNKTAIVYNAVGGNLESIRFDLGTQVKAGQIMALTDTRKVSIDLQNAIASQEKLKNDLQVYTELLEGKATTQKKVSELTLDYVNAKNKTEQIRKDFSNTQVKAPISGVVIEKNAEQGMYLNSGTQLATVVDISKLKVQVYLTESEVYQVIEGDTVSVTTDIYPNKIFKGGITYISPQADATHNYLVEVLIDNVSSTALKSGTFVYTSFSKKSDGPVLSIPKSALIESASKPSVYIIKNNIAFSKEIKLGSDIGDYVEVITGLKAGELVVVSGQINLKNQSTVTISNKTLK